MSTATIYRDIDDVKRANHDAGGHWFERDTMRFFDSRVSGRLFHNRYFISSERFRGFRAPDGDRAYTIREALPNGDIEEVGAFQQFDTAREARAGLERYIKSGAQRIVRSEPWKLCQRCDRHLGGFILNGERICGDDLFAAIDGDV